MEVLKIKASSSGKSSSVNTSISDVSGEGLFARAPAVVIVLLGVLSPDRATLLLLHPSHSLLN